MTPEELVWNALDYPRTSERVWVRVNKALPPSDTISWERIEQALSYWLATGKVRVTNKRFWRSMHIHKEH